MPAVNHLPQKPVVAELCNMKKPVRTGAVSKEANMSMLQSSKGHDLFISTKKKQLNDALRDLKNCKPENYATEEEYLAAKDRINAQIQKLQEELQAGDEKFTDNDTKTNVQMLGAFGDFFKTVVDSLSGFVKSFGDAIKGLGKDTLSWISGLFGKV